MRKSKRLDPALLNELIDELIAQAGSDDRTDLPRRAVRDR